MSSLYLYDDAAAREFEPFALTRPISELRAGTDLIRERWERAEARILRVYVGQGLLRTEDVDELAKQLVVTVIGIFADYLMSPASGGDNGVVPAELKRHVETAMEHIVQGIIASGS